ncbi:ATP-binding cassette domain-containing protein [Mesoplasma corruscae]|uniref:ABC transporter ATP-binding protein n=1 Tax=Mesoplasma corruscae TaxID=216874 RepID=A0A2S5RGZ6_9MOLU|nr:ATP-binding cassette domain-containing protein [Mesoplasma corruscae]PPE06492.1 ABC transporter ATP-binding protein [Mesoplasma corruscae]
MQDRDIKVIFDKKNIVEVENISKVYDKHTWALKKINLKIGRGECISLLGSNGSGKTTLLRILANNLEKTTGTIKYNFKEENILKSIGFQKREQAWPVGFKVKDINQLWYNIYQVEDLEWISILKDVFGITEIENKQLSKLSIIKLQMYAIFLALINKPELLLIDDLSSGIDFKYEEKISRFLKDYISNGNTVVLNYPSNYFLENTTTRIIYINDGEVFDDKSISDVRGEFRTISDYTKSIFREEIIKENRIKNKSKLFININSKLEEIISVIQGIIDDLSREEHPNAKINNTINNSYAAVLDLKTNIDNLSISYIDSAGIKIISTKIKTTIKTFNKVYLVSPYQKYEKTFRNIEKYLQKELKRTFNNEMVIVKGDTLSSTISESEKKQLAKLKEKYIKEEQKTIRKKILKQQFKKIESSTFKKGNE